jgi:hypothetical protein
MLKQHAFAKSSFASCCILSLGQVTELGRTGGLTCTGILNAFSKLQQGFLPS